MSIKRVFLIVFLSLGVNMHDAIAQEKKDTLTVLFVGNSYTYYSNLPQIVASISEGTTTKLITKMSTVGGASLKEHWLSERGLNTKALIENGNFDIVVLQEFSMGAVQAPEQMRNYAKLFADFIKKHKAKPYFYQTWAREKVPQYQATITAVYQEVADANKGIVVPVGEAWAAARKLRPELKLYDADGSHPSDLGTFLSACVFVAKITNEIPDQLDRLYRIKDAQGETVELMRLNALDVVFCQKIAKKVVLD